MDTRKTPPPYDLRTEPPPDPTKCRWCGEDLPPRASGKRGRPRVTHEGPCDRAYTTKSDTARRYAAFREAHRLQADRSTTMGSGELNYTDEVEGRFEPMPHDPFGEHIPRQWVEAWEANRRRMRPIWDYDRELLAQEEAERPDPFAGLTGEEKATAIQRAVERRKARGRLGD